MFQKCLTFFLIVTILLPGCGGKSGNNGKDIAEEVCDCSKKANAMDPADPNRGLAQNACLKKQREAWDQVKDDPKKAEAFNAVLMKCAEEQLEKSFGK